ncbi:MAG TPA: hypothetical protein VIK91_19400 [Nannocystis sp.]
MASDTKPRDPERIYLEPWPYSPEGRLWSAENAWPLELWPHEPEDESPRASGVEYIRSDLHAAEIARLTRELEEARRERSAARAEVLTAQASLRRVERELEKAREREREAATDIDLAWQFVATARRDYQPGDEGYNDCIEQAEDLLWRARKTLVTTPDTEGET